MNLCRGSVVLVFLIFSTMGFAQKGEINEFFSQGLLYQEEGRYSDAVVALKRVLTFDKEHSNALLEISYCYLEMKMADEALHYSAKVIKKEDDNLLAAYLINASAYELKGKMKASMKQYRKAIKIFPTSSLLHYNLALTYLNTNQFDLAEASAIRTIELNKDHASSHLLMAHIMYSKGERVKAMLALYYFLLLEQDTDRSVLAYEMLSQLWTQGVNREGMRQMYLAKSGVDETGFGSVELALLDDEKEQEEDILENEEENSRLKQFVWDTKKLFSIMTTQKKSKNDFWWGFYGEFFSNAQKLQVDEALAYYVSNCKYKALVLVWLSDNYKKFDAFNSWMYLH